jgi:hypothetical protein
MEVPPTVAAVFAPLKVEFETVAYLQNSRQRCINSDMYNLDRKYRWTIANSMRSRRLTPGLYGVECVGIEDILGFLSKETPSSDKASIFCDFPVNPRGNE